MSIYDSGIVAPWQPEDDSQRQEVCYDCGSPCEGFLTDGICTTPRTKKAEVLTHEGPEHYRARWYHESLHETVQSGPMSKEAAIELAAKEYGTVEDCLKAEGR